jgi:fucose permease
LAYFLISQPLNQLIYRRSLKLGILMGILLLIAAGIDEWVVHYYSVGIRAE